MIWVKILDIIKDKIDENDKKDIEKIEVNSLEPGKISLIIPSDKIKFLIKEKYKKEFQDAIQTVLGVVPTIELLIKKRRSSNVNPKYTFNNFVVGPSNQLTYAASFAVAEHPGKAYNPLFIYGGVGLGKTHLLYAIGNRISQKYNNLKVLYTSSEAFTNELVNSIQYKRMDKFREKYRNLNCLMIDDIQFISKKERTAEEFFYTFNALYENQSQIILSSDKSPNDIPDIEERLQSRFKWGLIVDIQPPELETRIAIINKKAELSNLNLNADVINFIASNIKSNIREIEGALIKIAAYSSIMRKDITISFVQDIMHDIVLKKEKMLTAENIQNVVAKHFNITADELTSRKRSKDILIPRETAMYLTRKITKNSLPEIKAKFGVKSHATIMNACKKIEKEISRDPELKEKIEKIEKEIIDV